MTTYSTYGTRAIDIDDGILASFGAQREDDLHRLERAIASGAARALLDNAVDVTDLQAEVHAEDWHTPQEGWELDALQAADRDALLELVERFVRDNLDRVVSLTAHIARDDAPVADRRWQRNQGMAIYRIGMLLGFTATGCHDAFAAHGRTAASTMLQAWATLFCPADWSSPWIDSREEPCLLHLAGGPGQPAADTTREGASS